MTFSSSTEGVHTIAEILSEPQTWTQCLSELLDSGQLAKINEKLNKNVEWIFVGCGSSFYLAQIAASSWSILTGIPARAIPASEILLFPELFPAPCQPVFISRSGRTSEIVEAAQYAESDLGIQSLAITCGIGTPIEEICSNVIRLSPADEKSTVMTRSFTSMLLALQALAADRASSKSFLTSLRALPTQVAPRLDGMQATVRSLVDKRTYARLCVPGTRSLFRGGARIHVEGERNVLFLRSGISHSGISSRSESDCKSRNSADVFPERKRIRRRDLSSTGNEGAGCYNVGDFEFD